MHWHKTAAAAGLRGPLGQCCSRPARARACVLGAQGPLRPLTERGALTAPPHHRCVVYPLVKHAESGGADGARRGGGARVGARPANAATHGASTEPRTQVAGAPQRGARRFGRQRGEHDDASANRLAELQRGGQSERLKPRRSLAWPPNHCYGSLHCKPPSTGHMLTLARACLSSARCAAAANGTLPSAAQHAAGTASSRGRCLCQVLAPPKIAKFGRLSFVRIAAAEETQP